jgi:hypothetical protein
MIRVNDIGSVTLDIGDLCTHCGRDTGAGSGLWVDRIPSCRDVSSFSSDMLDGYINISGWDSDLRKTNLVGYDLVDGYLCRECLEVE